MPLIQWDDSLKVNVMIFDQQHQKLVGMINELYDAMKEGRSKEVLGKILDGLVDYTITHFTMEEKVMEQHKYPAYTKQKREHENLTTSVRILQEKFKGGKMSVSIDTLSFLKSWLTDHIKGSDKAYGPYLNSKGVR